MQALQVCISSFEKQTRPGVVQSPESRVQNPDIVDLYALSHLILCDS